MADISGGEIGISENMTLVQQIVHSSYMYVHVHVCMSTRRHWWQAAIHEHFSENTENP